MGIDYKSAGVDVEAGDSLVDWLRESDAAKDSNRSQRAPWADHLVSGIGGFAAVFRMNFPEINKPCLVSATDGVGTKIKIAADLDRYESVGQDLVAMCVNDLICCGAQPLFFLDYYASGKLDLNAAKLFLSGVRSACHASGAALIGGETAEMPGLYRGRDFDAAGFAVGIVDEDEMLGPARVKIGDCAIGVSSSGFHSNGYSLLRKLFESELSVLSTPSVGNEAAQFEATKWADVLMTPTHLYPKLVLSLHRKKCLHAVAHITGGGMENIPRVLPTGTVLPLVDWAWPEAFVAAQDRSGLSRTEMLKTFNCGIGMVLFVDSSLARDVETEISASGFASYRLGTVSSANDKAAAAEVIY